MNQTHEQVINKTDLHFFRYCQDLYGINRGVYNTIEQWFYNKDILNIVDRRKYILCFLEFVYGNEKGDGKFGKEGLVNKLKRFWERLDTQME
ncbi:hypothetical protein [Lederbergia galactosidilytica]|uniref:Uncharacterized protein n=1 Tax=Lederbergia galactosidilytica TaxID=217031 RepID=A0A178A6J5_9BACI|nr:hypothetical protein [Lederbergia galactosidilytica]MBP1914413.1 hypothetical protein [Lederbergia galactosidilytica]OAK75752.1 hypothetical protein ABB05_00945 [Lederbergia galactosidilytica]